jgi:hypothetical protein
MDVLGFCVLAVLILYLTAIGVFVMIMLDMHYAHNAHMKKMSDIKNRNQD